MKSYLFWYEIHTVVFAVYSAEKNLVGVTVTWNLESLELKLNLNRALVLQLNMESSSRHFPRWYHLLSFSLHDCNISVSTKVMHNLN